MSNEPDRTEVLRRMKDLIDSFDGSTINPKVEAPKMIRPTPKLQLVARQTSKAA